MRDPHIDSILRAMKTSAVQRYALLVEETRRQTVRVEWTRRQRYDLAPYHFELGATPRGRRLAQAPLRPDGNHAQHAFDAEGRLVATRTLLFATRPDERLYVRTGAGIAEYHFSSDHRPGRTVQCLAVRWFSFDKRGEIARFDALGIRDEASWEAYERDPKGRITRIRRFDATSGAVELELEHDDAGALVQATRVDDDGDRTLVFRRVEAADGLLARSEELRSGIARAIISGLAVAKVRQPVYALAVHVSEPSYDRWLPPFVAFATEADAQHFRRTRHRDLANMAWSPDKWVGAGLDNVLRFRLAPPVAKLSAAASQDLLQNERHQELVALLTAVADTLRDAALPIRRSRGFVVYGFSTDASGAEHAAAAVSPEARGTLERWGLLAPLPGTVAADYPAALLEKSRADATARVAALEALDPALREELEYAGFEEDDVEEGRRILRWCEAAPGVPLESLTPWHHERLAQLDASPNIAASLVTTGPRPDELPEDPAAARLAKLRFLRVWLDGWDDTLRTVVTDPGDRERLGLL